VVPLYCFKRLVRLEQLLAVNELRGASAQAQHRQGSTHRLACVSHALLQGGHLLHLLHPRRKRSARRLQLAVVGQQLLPQAGRVALQRTELVHGAGNLGGVGPADLGDLSLLLLCHLAQHLQHSI
jgi:hypothetical protein